MRNVDVLDSFIKGDDLNFIFFNSNRENNKIKLGVTKTCLSQWYFSSFHDGVFEYETCEHYMMLQKLFIMNDCNLNDPMVSIILKSGHPSNVKAIGRQIPNFDVVRWEKHKFAIVEQGNYLKFSQNTNLKNFLLSTGDSILVEASPDDTIWGIGLDINSKNIENPITWKGENLLGYALMEVRDKLID